MIPIDNKTLQLIADSIGVKYESLTFLAGGREDSDGTIYQFIEGKHKKILKVVAKKTEDEVLIATKKLEFAYYLGECGIPIACPVRNSEGKIFNTVNACGHYFFASVMDFVEGKSPEAHEITPEVAKNWGQLTGAMHKATKKFMYWKNIPGLNQEWGYHDEIEDFYKMCHFDIVKERWLEIKERLDKISKSRENYGMLHNDNHQYNILKNNEKLTLIDFDCAGCHYFHSDILAPSQGILFDISGGVNRPITDKEALKRFYEAFLSGYELENHVEKQWQDEMDIFLDYRRLLLFTVMQGWMENDQKVREGFLRMMEEPVHLDIW